MVVSDEQDFPEQVRRAATGDGAARAALVSAFSPLARATAARLVDDRSVVDDVVQEAMVEVLGSLERLREPRAFPAWVRLAVRKHADRHRRTVRATDALPSESSVSSGPFVTDADLERRELTRSVRAALATLRTDDRHLLELRYLADWSIGELADALGISQGAVRKRLHDARRRARPALNPLIEQEHDMTDYEASLGRTYKPGDLAFARETTRPAVARPERREPIATGLKILDSIAPLARGGTVELVGPAGTGHLVLVLELSYRLNRTERESAVVGVASTRKSGNARSNLAKLVTEVDERGRHAVIESEHDHDARRALDEGSHLAAGLADSGIDVLLVVDRATADATGGAGDLKRHAGVSARGRGSVTLILLDAYERGLPLPADAGMDTRLVFSLEQVALAVYPALDPVESRAHFHDDALAADVRRLLEASTAVRRYFNQPMYASAEYTGEPATWVDREDSAAELRQLLADLSG